MIKFIYIGYLYWIFILETYIFINKIIIRLNVEYQKRMILI